MFRKFFCIVLSMVFAFCLFNTAVADDAEADSTESLGIASLDPYTSDRFFISENALMRASSFSLSPSLSISSPSTGAIKVVARAHTSIVVDKIGFSSLHIQRWNGSSWVTAASWYSQYKTNSISFAFTGNASGATSGSFYRAVCTFYAEKDGETESVTVTTSYIKCK